MRKGYRQVIHSGRNRKDQLTYKGHKVLFILTSILANIEDVGTTWCSMCEEKCASCSMDRPRNEHSHFGEQLDSMSQIPLLCI